MSREFEKNRAFLAKSMAKTISRGAYNGNQVGIPKLAQQRYYEARGQASETAPAQNRNRKILLNPVQV